MSEPRAPSPVVSPTGTLADEIFVGRSDELGGLRARLAAVAAAGDGRTVLVTGQAGVGKSRLCAEVFDHARRAGFLTACGRCYAGYTLPPYWPWIEALRSLLAATGSKLQAAATAEQLADVQHILPELRGTQQPAGGARRLSDPYDERFRLVDSVCSWLVRFAGQQPTLLLLEDLHNADPGSVDILEVLTQRLPGATLMVLGTFRHAPGSEDHEVADALGTLLALPDAVHLPLRGLSEQEAGLLTSAVHGKPLPRQTLTRLWQKTGGIPLYLTEIARAVALESADWEEAAPQAVLAVIRRRLRQLSPNAQRLVRCAAIFGEAFDATLLARAARIRPAAVATAVNEARAAGLLAPVSPSVMTCRFAHDVLRDALAGDLTPAARRRATNGLVRALEAHQNVSPEALARMYSELPATARNGKRLVEHCVRAGEAALRANAARHARHWFERARDRHARVRPRLQARIHAGLGLAELDDLSGLDVTHANLWLAFKNYLLAGDTEAALRTALMPVRGGVWRADAELPLQALERTSPNAADRARLLTLRARGVAERGDLDLAAALFGESLTVAERCQDRSAAAHVLAWWGRFDLLHGRIVAAYDKLQRAISLARAANDIVWELDARKTMADLYRDSGDRERFAAAVTETEQLARDARQMRLMFDFALTARDLARRRGDWEEARRATDRVLERYPRSILALGNRAYDEFEAGDAVVGRLFLRRLLDTPVPIKEYATYELVKVGVTVPLIARITGEPLHLEAGEASARATLAAPGFARIHNNGHLGLALLAIVRGDADAAQQQYDALATDPRRTTRDLCFEHLRGQLMHCVGSRDQAVKHLQTAVEQCEHDGNLPELAWSNYDLALALGARNADGDGAASLAALEAAESVAEQCRMPPLLQRVRDELRAQGAADRRSPAGAAAALTPRERDVLAAVVEGRSNGEIARDLFISEKTVETHMSRILAKTGCTNRTEAAVFATRTGLLGDT